MTTLMTDWLGSTIDRNLDAAVQWKEKRNLDSHAVLNAVYKDDENNLSVFLNKSQAVQMIEFLTFEEPIRVTLSDAYSCIQATFAASAVEAYVTEMRARLTEGNTGSVINILQYDLIVSPHSPRSQRVSLLIKDFAILGCAGSGRFGNPKSVECRDQVITVLTALSALMPKTGLHKGSLSEMDISPEGSPVRSQLGDDASGIEDGGHLGKTTTTTQMTFSTQVNRKGRQDLIESSKIVHLNSDNPTNQIIPDQKVAVTDRDAKLLAVLTGLRDKAKSTPVIAPLSPTRAVENLAKPLKGAGLPNSSSNQPHIVALEEQTAFKTTEKTAILESKANIQRNEEKLLASKPDPGSGETVLDNPSKKFAPDVLNPPPNSRKGNQESISEKPARSKQAITGEARKHTPVETLQLHIDEAPTNESDYDPWKGLTGISGRDVRIPKDQQTLLDRSDCEFQVPLRIFEKVAKDSKYNLYRALEPSGSVIFYIVMAILGQYKSLKSSISAAWLPPEPGQRGPHASVPLIALQSFNALAERRAQRAAQQIEALSDPESADAISTKQIVVLAESESEIDNEEGSESEEPFSRWGSSSPRLDAAARLPPDSSAETDGLPTPPRPIRPNRNHPLPLLADGLSRTLKSIVTKPPPHRENMDALSINDLVPRVDLTQQSFPEPCEGSDDIRRSGANRASLSPVKVASESDGAEGSNQHISIPKHKPDLENQDQHMTGGIPEEDTDRRFSPHPRYVSLSPIGIQGHQSIDMPIHITAHDEGVMASSKSNEIISHRAQDDGFTSSRSSVQHVAFENNDIYKRNLPSPGQYEDVVENEFEEEDSELDSYLPNALGDDTRYIELAPENLVLSARPPRLSETITQWKTTVQVNQTPNLSGARVRDSSFHAQDSSPQPARNSNITDTKADVMDVDDHISSDPVIPATYDTESRPEVVVNDPTHGEDDDIEFPHDQNDDEIMLSQQLHCEIDAQSQRSQSQSPSKRHVSELESGVILPPAPLDKGKRLLVKATAIETKQIAPSSDASTEAKRKTSDVGDLSPTVTKRRKQFNAPKSFHFSQDNREQQDTAKLGRQHRRDFLTKLSNSSSPKDDRCINLTRRKEPPQGSAMTAALKDSRQPVQRHNPQEAKLRENTPLDVGLVELQANAQANVDELKDSVIVDDILYKEPLTEELRVSGAMPKVGTLAAPSFPQSQPDQTKTSIRQRESSGLVNATMFDKFQSTYPQYAGNIAHFVTMCTRIEMLLAGDCMEHRSLWDDFIGRHKTDYKQYILDCAEQGDDAVPYEKFYRDEIEEPTYTKRVVTPTNLKEVLALNPNLAAACRQRFCKGLRNKVESPKPPTPQRVDDEPPSFTNKQHNEPGTNAGRSLKESIQGIEVRVGQGQSRQRRAATYPAEGVIDLTLNSQESIEPQPTNPASTKQKPKSLRPLPWAKPTPAQEQPSTPHQIEATRSRHFQASEASAKSIATSSYTPKPRLEYSKPLTPRLPQPLSTERCNVFASSSRSKPPQVDEEPALIEPRTSRSSVIDWLGKTSSSASPSPSKPSATAPISAPAPPAPSGHVSKTRGKEKKDPESKQWWRDRNTPFREFARAYVGLKGIDGSLGTVDEEGIVKGHMRNVDILGWSLK
ncbi:MAG: hypothetical protein M1827_006745 [Pycnora praestabilis]|nr:MAG: hypothetical protein M1827_006745 [Pycnora praestabilis]